MKSGPLSQASAKALPRVGRYELLHLLTDEGFVSLWAARVRGPNAGPRIVELSKVHHGFAREVEVEAAFLAEARAASRVRHPNFVHPTDTLVHNGDLYVATELTLAMRLDELWRTAVAKSYEIPLPVALRILLDALAGLSALHATLANVAGSRAIVHGDTAPANIAVGHQGDSAIVHSGLSLVTSRVGARGNQNPRLAYKAPEQLRTGVNAVAIGPGADVFAAGVILWEMLSGTRLFDAASDVEVVERILHRGVVSPDLGGTRRVPAPLLPLVTAALERTAERRPRSAAELGTALETAAGVRVATPHDVAKVVDELAGDILGERRAQIEKLVALADESIPPESPLRNIVPELRRPESQEVGAPSAGTATVRRVPTKLSIGHLRVAPETSGPTSGSRPSGEAKSPLLSPPEPAVVASYQGSSRIASGGRATSSRPPKPGAASSDAPQIGWLYYGAFGAVVGTLVFMLIAGPARRAPVAPPSPATSAVQLPSSPPPAQETGLTTPVPPSTAPSLSAPSSLGSSVLTPSPPPTPALALPSSAAAPRPSFPEPRVVIKPAPATKAPAIRKPPPMVIPAGI